MGIDPKNVVIKYIIYETDLDKTTYRILDKESGRMVDTTKDTIDKFHIAPENPVKLKVKSIKTYSGRLKTGLNDLDTWCRMNNALDILEQYNSATNELKATEVSRGSINRVNWKCQKCGKEWPAIIKVRTSSRCGCPHCAIEEGRYRIHTDADLFINKAKALGLEYLIKEFNEDSLDINTVYASNQTSIHWKCAKCGHEFTNCIPNRLRGQGCPKCRRVGTSVSEQVVILH